MDKEVHFSSFSMQYWVKKEISTETLGLMKKMVDLLHFI